MITQQKTFKLRVATSVNPRPEKTSLIRQPALATPQITWTTLSLYQSTHRHYFRNDYLMASVHRQTQPKQQGRSQGFPQPQTQPKPKVPCICCGAPSSDPLLESDFSCNLKTHARTKAVGLEKLCTRCFEIIRRRVDECMIRGYTREYTIGVVSGMIGISVGGLVVANIINRMWRLPR